MSVVIVVFAAAVASREINICKVPRALWFVAITIAQAMLNLEPATKKLLNFARAADPARGTLIARPCGKVVLRQKGTCPDHHGIQMYRF